LAPNSRHPAVVTAEQKCDMTKTFKILLVGTSVLALLAITPSKAGPPKSPPTMSVETESELIANLSSPDEATVLSALTHLKKGYLHSTNAVQAVKKLLTDSRLKVKERAAGWLGVCHATVNEDEVKAICALLNEPSANANTEGLKALRGLQGLAVAGAVPDVLPFLKSSNSHLMRDACRTLAVIGGKDLIPQIEPLLNNGEPAVRKDAQDAINQLQSKS